MIKNSEYEPQFIDIRKSLIYQTNICVLCKRWQDSRANFNQLLQFIKKKFPGADLNPQEKNLFTASYKHLIEQARKQWRTCHEEFQKEEEQDPDESTNFKLPMIKLTKAQIERELRELCKEQYLTAKYFMHTSKQAQKSIECRVFYFKTIADSFRYLASVEQTQGSLQKLKDEATKRYKVALVEAMELEPTLPIRLATILNYGCFLYETLDDVESAIAIVQKGFDDSMMGFNALDYENADVTTRVMCIMEQNLEIWKMDGKHVRRLQDKENFKIIHDKLAQQGIQLNEGQNFDVGNSEESVLI